MPKKLTIAKPCSLCYTDNRKLYAADLQEDFTMATVTIIGSGMMGSALAFPARENGHEVRLVGTHLDREIIENCIKNNQHPKFNKEFPAGMKYYQIEDVKEAIAGSDMIIGGVSSFGVDWFGDVVLPKIPENIPVITVTKGLMDTEDGRLLTAGGRVLGVVCTDKTLSLAVEKAYREVEKVHFENAYYRSDIGKKALMKKSWL